jgi:LysR family transcriptional regulator (chromosome initiation inhibitor)
MLDYKLLEALAAVADEGGFERAAKRLNLTQSAVSQRIRQLEEVAGLPLVTRAKPPRPTERGRELVAHYRRVALLEAELADGRTGGHDPGGRPWRTLTLAVNADSLATWFTGAVLPALRRERLALDLKVLDQELTFDLLRAGEVAGCVSTRQTPMQGCNARFLGVMRYHCLCEPSFAREHFPRGLTLDAARSVPAVVYDRHDSVHDRFLQRVLGQSPTTAPRHYVPDSDRFVDFVLGGAGFGLVPHLQCEAHVRAGRLVDLAPDSPQLVPLSWHCWAVPSRMLAAVEAALVAAAARVLRPV